MNKKENGTIGFCDSPPATCPFDPSPTRHQWKQDSLLCWLPLSLFHKKKITPKRAEVRPSQSRFSPPPSAYPSEPAHQRLHPRLSMPLTPLPIPINTVFHFS
ncbi:hypothetical protein ACB098_03G054700 [Castanea mollissima]